MAESFIHQKYPELHTSKPVEQEQKRRRTAKLESSQKPTDKLKAWFEVIKKTHGHEEPEVKERIKRYYQKEYVIKPEDVPAAYFENQKRLAREQGHGEIEITEEMKNQHIDVIISDQKSTLNTWVTYFTHPDSNVYPVWAKYWAFREMLKLSTYDKEKKIFAKRDKNTVAPFPDLNRESLAYVIDMIDKKVKKDMIDKKAKKEKIQVTEDNPELQQLLQSASFGKLYAYAIEKVTPTEENELVNTKGQWIKFPQNTDPTSYIPKGFNQALVPSLQGHGTGWCTAGESTAKTQLQGGDFYVYYSNDQAGQPIIPRVAIRMEGANIGEVRGIAPDQNLDPYIGQVVVNKLKEFPDGQTYQKKSADMKRLTEIDRKIKKQQEPSLDELRFLYEIDNRIEGFGYEKDPRIEELLQNRDKRSDLSLIIGCKKEEISLTKEEALSGEIKYHYGDLDLSSLTSAQGLKLPETVGGYLDLSSLTSAQNLKLPKTIGGSLNLRSLTSAQDIKLPETVGGGLDLENLTSVKGLKLPETIGGSLNLRSLTSAQNLKLPKTIGGSLNLRSLTSAQGLKLPETVGGYLDLSSLTSAQNLKLPKTIGGSLNLRSLTSAQDIKLPETVGGGLDLENLTSVKGLKLPETIGGDLNLNSLTSAKGLKLPETIGGDLNLNSLTSAKGLKLPETIGGYVYLISLTFEEKEILKEKYPNLNIY